MKKGDRVKIEQAIADEIGIQLQGSYHIDTINHMAERAASELLKKWVFTERKKSTKKR